MKYNTYQLKIAANGYFLVPDDPDTIRCNEEMYVFETLEGLTDWMLEHFKVEDVAS